MSAVPKEQVARCLPRHNEPYLPLQPGMPRARLPPHRSLFRSIRTTQLNTHRSQLAAKKLGLISGIAGRGGALHTWLIICFIYLYISNILTNSFYLFMYTPSLSTLIGTPVPLFRVGPLSNQPMRRCDQTLLTLISSALLYHASD